MNRETLSNRVSILGLCLLLWTCGGGGGGNSNSNPVSIQNQNGYYSVTLDFSNTSHLEMGSQLALSINSAMPNYEQVVDSALKTQIDYLQYADPPVNFSTVRDRAKALLGNPTFNQDYADEIQGMQQVFNYQVDNLGDGRLSKNELLVFQLFPDVMRSLSCSASAAYGSGTASGKTILSRNLDWITALLPEAGMLHAITSFKNGNKTVANIGLLGQLAGISMFNTSKVFGAILDSSTGANYPDLVALGTRRSYIFDLRNALENYTKLSDVSNFMTSPNHLYTYNHLIFLADETTAGVVENQVNPLTMGSPGNRNLRVEASPLNPSLPSDQTWNILGAFATVNDFRLPANDFVSELYNTARWESFKSKYSSIAQGQIVDVNTMQAIAGYSGPFGDGKMESGAVFVSEPQQASLRSPLYFYPVAATATSPSSEVPAYTTIQSILIDMSTMELWAHFGPSQAIPPRSPTYQKITNPIY